jgi:transposase
MDVRCAVIAPTLIPTAPGDRVKTDRRDCRRLARLHRAGELVPIRVPTIAEEAVRDLCRARADLVADRARARLRLGGFLLRHGRIWRGGSTWTFAHERWLTSQRFDDPALATTYAHYRATLQARDAALDAIEADLTSWYDQPPFADAVARLAAYRASPAWAPSPWPARSATGAGSHRTPVHGVLRVDPERVLQRQLDLAGSHHHVRQRPSGAQLVESAWAYQHRPQATLELRRRQAGLPPEVVARAWTAQLRLCARFRRLHARKQCRQVVVIAVARELAGFLWAEMAA